MQPGIICSRRQFFRDRGAAPGINATDIVSPAVAQDQAGQETGVTSSSQIGSLVLSWAQIVCRSQR